MNRLSIHFRVLFLVLVCFCTAHLAAKPAEVTPYDVTSKMHEIMRAHASYKKVSPLIAKRALDNFIAILDPSKTYFLQSDIARWLSPSDELLEHVSQDFEKSRFPEFEKIFDLMTHCVERRVSFEGKLASNALPRNVSAKEFKNLQWCTTEEGLYERIVRMRALYMESIEKMDSDFKELSMQRLLKMRHKNEEIIVSTNKKLRQQLLCTYLLKAFASSLDAHTMYFTPLEASQFLISVQQRLTGIGVQLRDDIDGFTVVKMLEGGPAVTGGELRVKDKIIAIDREPIVGLDGLEVVERIRGKEGTEVIVTVLRDVLNDDTRHTETREIHIKRNEVVIKESRVESSQEAYGDGIIACLKLHSFYQDIESSSASDLTKAFSDITALSKVKGVVLDLRFNGGGLLPQAVEVVGLFIKKGIVASIKDENGHVQHLRDVDSKMIWDGPLIVLVDRLSASAAEIVAQALQDYGRAIIVGDDHTFGKGSFQIFTMTTTSNGAIDPQGEYKVTRGRYYTVSGKTPQLVGVQSDIRIPGVLAYEEVGESFTKYPLENDSIPSNFDDTLADIPFYQRERIRKLYQFDLQKPITKYRALIDQLKKNSDQRQASNKSFQMFLEEIKSPDNFLRISSFYHDFQEQEAMNVMKDFIFLLQEQDQNLSQKLDQVKQAA